MTYEPKLFKRSASGSPAAGPPYVLNDRLRIALDVALAAERPVLISGAPGSGKTTLAEAAAGVLGWPILKQTVTSRTKLEDLEADFDHLQRLSDAQLGKELAPDWAYLRPGVLWRAFDPQGAARNGAGKEELEQFEETHPLRAIASAGEEDLIAEHAVVLLDEIDKADPDLPNDLLEPLDRGRFDLPLRGRAGVQKAPGRKILLMLTTNGERDLPPAFLRRCVVVQLDDPISAARKDAVGSKDAITLEEIAAAHYPDAGDDDKALFKQVANALEALRNDARKQGLRPPSAAEYLDAVRALKAVPELLRPDVWAQVQELLISKTQKLGG